MLCNLLFLNIIDFLATLFLNRSICFIYFQNAYICKLTKRIPLSGNSGTQKFKIKVMYHISIPVRKCILLILLKIALALTFKI